MPLSSELADAVLAAAGRLPPGRLARPRDGSAASRCCRRRCRCPRLPTPQSLLVEHFSSREGQHLFLYPFAGRQRAHRAGAAARVAAGARAAKQLLASASTTTASSCSAPTRRWTRRRCMSRALFDERRAAARRARQPEQRRAGAAALSRDRARRRAGVQRLPRCAEEHAPAAGLSRACSSRSSASTTPATACSTRPRPRCCCRNWTSPGCAPHCSAWRKLQLQFVELAAPSPFSLPLMVERFREQLSTEKLADRLARMVSDAERLLDTPRPARRRR